jgi:hypothetical protein
MQRLYPHHPDLVNQLFVIENCNHLLCELLPENLYTESIKNYPVGADVTEDRVNWFLCCQLILDPKLRQPREMIENYLQKSHRNPTMYHTNYMINTLSSLGTFFNILESLSGHDALNILYYLYNMRYLSTSDIRSTAMGMIASQGLDTAEAGAIKAKIEVLIPILKSHHSHRPDDSSQLNAPLKHDSKERANWKTQFEHC